jgi:hypothetical protein
MKAKRNLIQFCLLCVTMLPAGAQAQFTFTTNNGAITITSYTDTGTVVAIPDATNGYPVTTIGNSAFQYNSSLTNVLIPDSVTSIGDFAFASCSGLTSVTIPNSVTNIGNNSFFGCNSATSFTIGNGVSSIGVAAFQACTSLTSLTIPDGVINIGIGAFSFCSSLTNITFPDSVTSIGSFDYCTSLTSITIPRGVTSIAGGAFEYCTSLGGVYFLGDAPHPWSIRVLTRQLCHNLLFTRDHGLGCLCRQFRTSDGAMVTSKPDDSQFRT